VTQTPRHDNAAYRQTQLTNNDGHSFEIRAGFLYGNGLKDEQVVRTFSGGGLNLQAVLDNAHHQTSEVRASQRAEQSSLAAHALVIKHHSTTEISLVALWARFHNSVAADQSNNSNDSDEEIFRSTKRLIVAVWQNMATNELAPVLGLRPYVHGTTNAALDSSHIQQAVYLLGALRLSMQHDAQLSMIKATTCSQGATQVNGHADLCFKASCRHAKVQGGEVDSFIAAAATAELPELGWDTHSSAFAQYAQAVIPRAEVMDVPSFAEFRRDWGLPAASNISTVLRKGSPSQLAAANTRYQSVDELDAVIGALAEMPQPGQVFGELATTILARSIAHARQTQWQWFENSASGILTESERHWVGNMTMAGVLAKSGFDFALLPSLSCNQTPFETCLDDHSEATSALLNSCGATSRFDFEAKPSDGALEYTVGDGLALLAVLAWVALGASAAAAAAGRCKNAYQAFACCTKPTSKCVQSTDSQQHVVHTFDWSAAEAVPSDLIAAIEAASHHVLAWHQPRAQGKIKVLAASPAQMHETLTDGSVRRLQVVLLSTPAAVLCLACKPTPAQVCLFVPSQDIQSLFCMAGVPQTYALDICGGQTVVLSGNLDSHVAAAAQAVPSEGPASLTQLNVDLRPSKQWGLIGGPDSLRHMHAVNAEVSIALEALRLQTVDLETQSRALNVPVASLEKMFDAYTAVLQVTKTLGISRDVFAHLMGVQPDNRALQMIWRQHSFAGSGHRQDSKQVPVAFCKPAIDSTAPAACEVIAFDSIKAKVALVCKQQLLGPNAMLALLSMLQGAPPHQAQTRWLFAALDQDRDGTVSFDEIRFLLRLTVQGLGLSVGDEDLSTTTHLILQAYSASPQEDSLPRDAASADCNDTASTGMNSQTSGRDTQRSEERLLAMFLPGFSLFMQAMAKEGMQPHSLLTAQLPLGPQAKAGPLWVADINSVAAPVSSGILPKEPSADGKVLLGQSTVMQWLLKQAVWLQVHSALLAWGVAFCLLLAASCIERAQTYSQKPGLNAILGPGVTIARAAAHITTICTACILLTRCGFVWAFVQGSRLAPFFPVNDIQAVHGWLGWLYLGAVLLHIAAHVWNFMHVAVISPLEAGCVLGGHVDDFVTNFWQWLFLTLPGLSGFILTLVATIFFAFVVNAVRRSNFAIFTRVHQLYMVLLIGVFFHGSQGKPEFWLIIGGPLVLFCLDKMVEAKLQKRAWEIL